MSGICGIIHWDGMPVEMTQLKKMAEMAAYRGPDGIRYHVRDNAGMAHLAFHTTPQAVFERQPLAVDGGRLVLVADARLDNRDEIIPTLIAKGAFADQPVEEITDVEIILGAYRCWGEESPTRLRGDFSFAIWDNAEQRFFAAVDHQAIRPFYYRAEQSHIHFSSEANQMFYDPGFACRINEIQVARDLALTYRNDASMTYFEGVSRLGPAQRMVIKNGDLRITKYWELIRGSEIRYQRNEEYAEHLVDLLKGSVRAALRSQHPTAVLLSGGLDSCSVLALGAEGLREKPGGLTPELRAVSLQVESEPELTEVAISSQVAQLWQVPQDLVTIDDLHIFSASPEEILHPDSPQTTPWASFLCKAMDESGERSPTWLSGMDGDNKVGVGNSLYYLDLLLSGRWKTLAGSLRRHHDQYNVSWLWLLRDFIFTPLIWEPSITRLATLRRSILKNPVRLPAHIHPDLARRTHLTEWILSQGNLHLIGDSHGLNIADYAADYRMRLLNDPRNHHTFAMFERLGVRKHIETRHPWSDIRLAEYVLQIPYDQIGEGLHRKTILRRGLAGKLPEAALMRAGLKTGPEAWVRKSTAHPQVTQVLSELSKNSPLLKRDWVNPGAWQSMIENLSNGKLQLTGGTWYRLSLALWLATYHA